MFYRVPTSRYKRGMDGRRIATDGVRYSFERPTFFSERLGTLDIERDSGKSVVGSVLSFSHKLQIFDSIVFLILIFVMDFLAAKKTTAKMNFHHVAMNLYAFAVYIDSTIARAAHRFVFTGHVVSTQNRTEESLISRSSTFSDIRFAAFKTLFAGRTDKRYNFGSHSVSLLQGQFGQSPCGVATSRGLVILPKLEGAV